ncbi:hypothetical protein PP180_03115 [Muricauda sp. SK9]|uniref:hypothetical protein n=1 Tax=Flavobacteriaceae TaxID=49546 RepID=UPI0011C386D9|nr:MULTISPECIES: hypothetical protein [Allomuricauda]MDC6384340.1 hypothetical protein [Muricauda sp. SK9]
MKTYISYLVIALLMTHTLTAQVKIGDNPQNLNNSSVLELESTSRVLVITRVNDLQMNAISPLRGALVYNTDHDCLHYYTGTEWVNICEELDNSFTVSTRADHMRPINPNALDNTVVITETPNPDGSINYNFEVGIINGANIAPSAVNGDKIQNGSVGSQDLAPRSVGLSHLQDGGANGDLFQWNGSAWTLINEADISITESQDLADVIAVDPSAGNQQIKDLQNPTAAQDAATKAYVDTEITNNAANGSETILNNGTDINITGNGTAATPYVINSTFTEAQNLADVIAIDPSAGNSAITDVLDPTDPQDAATKAYVDTEITNNAANGSETILNNGTDINITGNGTAATPYVINSTFTEAQNLADVIAIDPSAGNSAITDVLDPTDPQDAATKAYVDGITVTEGEGITVTPSGQEFNVTVTNPVIAMGKIISGALGTNFGINNFANNTGGSYEIILSTTPSDFIVQLTTSSNLGARSIQVTNQTANSFEVQIYEGTSLSDSDWHFTVIAF